MANIKISDLPLIANIPPTAGVFPIVYNNVTYKMDWSQLNNQITASGANPLNITGTGTTNFIPKWTTGGSVIENSVISDVAGAVAVAGDVTIDNGASSTLVLEKDAAGNAKIQFNNVNTQTSYISLDGAEEMTYYGASGVPQVFYAGGLLNLTLSGTTATFSGSVTVGGYLTGQGTNPGGLGGSRYVLDWLSGSMRIFSYGADASTNGGFNFYSQRSDGTNSFNPLTITSGGNVGIGIDSPSAKLEVQNVGTSFGVPSNAALSLSSGGGVGQYNQILLGYSAGNFSPAAIGFVTTNGASETKGDLVFGTRDLTTASAPIERMRIASGGDVGVGTTPNAAGPTWRTLFIGSAGTIISRQANTGYETIFSSNYYINSSNVDTRRVVGGSSRMMLDGDVIKFQNAPTGAVNVSPSWTERLTISSGGDATFSGSVSVGGGGSGGTGHLAVRKDAGIPVSIANESQTGTLVIFSGDGAGIIGSITHNGASTAYNTTSDYRLKENVTPITNALSRVNQLKPSRFNFIADADKIVDGFIAHEVQDIVPEAISGAKDAVNEDGTPDYQGIDQSKIVPLLTAAIQEQQTLIDTLTARIDTLENN